MSQGRRYDLGRVLAALPVIAALPVTLFAAVLMYVLWDAQQQQARREIQHSVQTLAVALDREITGQVRRAQLLAEDATLKDGRLAAFSDKVQRILDVTPEWASVQLVGTNGADVLDPDIVRGSRVALVDRPDARSVFLTGKPDVSDLFTNPSTARGSVSIDVPVRRDGRVTYALIVQLDLSWLARILVDLYQDDGAATVLDREMRVIARNKGMPEVVGRLATPDALKMMTAAPRGVEHARNLDNVNVYNAWQRTDFGWTAAVGRPADVFDAPLRRSLGLLALAGLVLLAAGMEVARRLARLLTAEITESANDALRLAEGAAFPVRRSRIEQLAALRDTLMLTSERLQALLVAERSANAAKDQFLAMLGHELRNPLSPIVAALELMKLKGAVSPEQEIIRRQVANLTRLVDDLLDVARIARGNIELSTQPVEIAEPVGRAVEIVRPLIAERKHTLALDLPPHGLAVEADVHRMAQVISNLLTNAAKYSDPGSRIAVTATRDASMVRVSVKDEGSGIAPEMLQRIFDSFVQQPQTLDRSHGGLGLGLAIARNLVRLHGGTLEAKSAGEGRGSEFIVSLPAIAPLAGAQDERAGCSFAPLDRPLRVLVVDDNRDAEYMHCRVLEALGCTVASAHDAESALAVAASFEPQVALLDIGLPGMDGYELAQRLRERLGSALTLVALTGYGQDSDRLRSRAFGFDRHLTKPVDVQTLRAVLVDAAERERR